MLVHYLPLLLFAVPVLRLLHPLWQLLGLAGSRPNGWLGRIERPLSAWRGLAAVGWALWLLAARQALWPALAALALALFARWQRRRDELICAQWLWDGTDLLPGTYFAAVDQAYGPAGPAGPPRGARRSPEGYDLRQGASGRRRLAFLRVFLDSAWMTRIALRSARGMEPAMLLAVVDRAMRLWGLRVLQHARARLVTEGAERLAGLLPGRRLFLLNHVSQTDFAFCFPALDRFIGGPDEIKLRFIVARDHFVDNPLIHRVSGIGRFILAAGMVPIDRKRTRDAVEALEQAARTAAAQPIDLGVYPQGTRGRPWLDDDGQPFDVGFYSSAPAGRAADPTGHVKPGSAFLALDLALALNGQPLHLVVVGIEGAGRLLPKGRLAMTAGLTLTYRVGEVITIGPRDVEGLVKRDPGGRITEAARARAAALVARIERALAAACRIDERLGEAWQRWFERPMPDCPGLRRLFDHALALPPARRGALFEALRGLPAEPTEEQVAPIFELLPRA